MTIETKNSKDQPTTSAGELFIRYLMAIASHVWRATLGVHDAQGLPKTTSTSFYVLTALFFMFAFFRHMGGDLYVTFASIVVALALMIYYLRTEVVAGYFCISIGIDLVYILFAKQAGAAGIYPWVWTVWEWGCFFMLAQNVQRRLLAEKRQGGNGSRRGPE
jgi:hypothetical protein